MPSRIGKYYAMRYRILERDNFTCQYCGQKAPNVMLEVDHVIPISEGGETKEDNLKASCRACNRGKGILCIKKHKPIIPIRRTQDEAIKILGNNKPIRCSGLAKALGTTKDNARMTLQRLYKRGCVDKISRGLYCITKAV